MDLSRRWTDQTTLEDEVVVWGAQGRNTTWHTDADCARFARHKSRPVEIWVTAGSAEAALSSHKRHRRYACASCALPELIALSVRAARQEPHQALRAVLACPQSRIGQDSSHRKCPRCRDLALVAEQHEAVTYTDGRGYRLVALTVHWSLRSSIAKAFPIHEVPAGSPDLTRDGLAVAWSARDNGHPAPSQTPADREDRHEPWFPVNRLNFTAAALVTSPGA